MSKPLGAQSWQQVREPEVGFQLPSRYHFSSITIVGILPAQSLSESQSPSPYPHGELEVQQFQSSWQTGHLEPQEEEAVELPLHGVPPL